MDIWKAIKQSIQEMGGTLDLAWGNATAAPASFSHLLENEREILEPIHEDFVNKAQRGYFDDDVVRDYERFLWRCGFETPQIKQSVQYLENVAKSAIPLNRQIARQVQDRYWQETGLQDTRKPPSRYYDHE